MALRAACSGIEIQDYTHHSLLSRLDGLVRSMPARLLLLVLREEQHYIKRTVYVDRKQSGVFRKSGVCRVLNRNGVYPDFFPPYNFVTSNHSTFMLLLLGLALSSP